MIALPPKSYLTDPLFPSTPLFRSGGIRLAADPASDRIGARVCRVWRRLRDRRDRLAVGGGRGAADALGPARRAVVPVRDGGHHVFAPPPVTGGLPWPASPASASSTPSTQIGRAHV